jgi:hypothetical protein
LNGTKEIKETQNAGFQVERAFQLIVVEIIAIDVVAQ